VLPRSERTPLGDVDPPRPGSRMTDENTSHLEMTRAAYDTVAADYTELVRSDLPGKPFDRALLTAFA
jgi:hypothetical protein